MGTGKVCELSLPLFSAMYCKQRFCSVGFVLVILILTRVEGSRRLSSMRLQYPSIECLIEKLNMQSSTTFHIFYHLQHRLEQFIGSETDSLKASALWQQSTWQEDWCTFHSGLSGTCLTYCTRTSSQSCVFSPLSFSFSSLHQELLLARRRAVPTLTTCQWRRISLRYLYGFDLRAQALRTLNWSKQLLMGRCWPWRCVQISGIFLFSNLILLMKPSRNLGQFSMVMYVRPFPHGFFILLLANFSQHLYYSESCEVDTSFLSPQLRYSCSRYQQVRCSLSLTLHSIFICNQLFEPSVCAICYCSGFKPDAIQLYFWMSKPDSNVQWRCIWTFHNGLRR